jgi:DNA polymerase epsilon subunit 3
MLMLTSSLSIEFVAIQSDKRNSYRRKVKQEKLAAAQKFAEENTSSAGILAAPVTNGHGRQDSPPPAKKVKHGSDIDEVHGSGSGVSEGEDVADETVEEHNDEEDDDDGEDVEDGEQTQEDLVEDPLEPDEDGHNDGMSDGDSD